MPEWIDHFSACDASVEDIAVLEANINIFNCEKIGVFDGKDLSIISREASNRIYAGLHGFTWGGYCEVKLLWVEQAKRSKGIGSTLLASAEHEARERGCRTVILTTHSFQAPGFYEKHGYRRISEVADCPKGQSHISLMKTL